MVSSHFFRNLMETEENRDDRIRLAAMIWYAETRAAGFDREQAGALVRRLFRDEIAEGVIRDAADPAAAIRREFPPLKCFDCEHCPAAGKGCDYPGVREVLLKIAKGMKAENVSQEKLLELLNALNAG